jgi:WD40 repeat protein
VALSPDGKRFATGSRDGKVKIWESATGRLLLTLSGHAEVRSVSFSPDGTRLVTGSGDRTAKVWDTASGQELFTLPGHTDLVSGVAFSLDGTRLATSSYDGTVRVYVLRIEDLMALARSRVTRSLTTEECDKYLHLEQCPPAP